MTTRSSLDPSVLANAYALWHRVSSGVTKYTRDEADTISPMMSRLRADAVKNSLVIDAFLAAQRFLTLRAIPPRHIAAYCDRILFISIIQGLVINRSDLPFAKPPCIDERSAAFFQVMCSEDLDFVPHGQDGVALFDTIMQRMKQIQVPMQEDLLEMPIAGVEDETEVTRKIYEEIDKHFIIKPNKTVH
jgi:hypothetical protein